MGSRIGVAFPPQHGAWAFLIVPLLLGALLGAATWPGLIFAGTWIVAYPTTYYLARGVIARLRRGAWTDRAIRELRAAVPWGIASALGVVTLLVLRPWIIVPGLLVVALWCVSAVLAWQGRERGIANDILLVVLAAIALPLMWMVANDIADVTAVPRSIWLAALVVLVYFIGSVLHVKSLIREARDRRWHWASVVFGVVSLMTAFISLWLLIPFTAALIRTVMMKSGTKPGRIGAVESVVALLVVVCTVLATR